MKKSIFILLTGFFLFSCVTLHEIKETKVETEYNRYSYEGMIDPLVILETWIEIKTVFLGNGWWEVYYKSPNGDRIHIASIMIYQTGMILVYTYLYNNEPYCFKLNNEGCYKAFTLSDKLKAIFKQDLLDALDGAIT